MRPCTKNKISLVFLIVFQSQESPVHRVIQDIELRFIQSGKPDQSAHIESFNRTYHEEEVSAYLLDSLEQVREIAANGLRCDSEIRPHDVLGTVPASPLPRALACRE